MKKQGMKKLVLARESVRILDERLGTVAGGYTNITCYDSCPTLRGTYCDCSQKFICQP
jgi:hypothetical protein